MVEDEAEPEELDLGLVLPHGPLDPGDPSAGIVVCEFSTVLDGVPLLDVHLMRKGADGTPEGVTLELPMSDVDVTRARALSVLSGPPASMPPAFGDPLDAMDVVLDVCRPGRDGYLTDRLHLMVDFLVQRYRVSRPSDAAVGAHAASVRSLASAWLSTLDPGAVDLLLDPRHRLVTDRRTYEGLTRDGPLARAVRAAPVLAEVTNRAWLSGAAFPADPFRADVERMAVDYLTAVGLPRGVMRLVPAACAAVDDALADGESPVGARRHGVPFAVRAVHALAPLPENWRPRDVAEWRAWFDLVPVTEVMRNHPGLGVTPSRLDGGGGWQDCVGRLCRASGVGAEELPQALLDVRDMLSALGDELVVPALNLAAGSPRGADHVGVVDDEVARIHAGVSLTTLLDASRRWHERRRGIAAAKSRLRGDLAFDDRWEAALPSLGVDGMSVTVLTDAMALEDEGGTGPDADGIEGLSHCVGGYDRACASGDCRIVSLRTVTDGVAARSSTAELAWDDGSGRLVVRQHLGRANRRPPDRDVDVLARYVAMTEASPGLVGRALRVRRELDGTSVTAACGYDWHSPGNWEALERLWAPYLPRALRGLTPEAFAEAVAPDALEELRTMNGYGRRCAF